MKDTSLRRIETLRLIPRAPLWITTASLVEHLKAMNYEVTQRTVQRDLNELSTIFPLDCDLEGRTNRWCWLANAEVLDLPGMNSQTALTFFLAEQYLYEMLPPTATDAIDPHFNKAREVLHQTKSSKMDHWVDKVRILPESQRLLPASPKQEIIEGVYTALLEGHPFSAHYQKKGEKSLTHYEVINPLGLVFRNRIIYLVATLWDYEDPLQFALHRFNSVSILENQPIYRPKDFNLDHYIDTGNFDYIAGDEIKLELIFTNHAATHLNETPLSNDQQLTTTRDGKTRVKATVKNSDRLRWWIRGFGATVEVVKPASLRKEFADMASALCARYTS